MGALAWVTVCTTLVGFIDYLTGTRVSLTLLYLAPVAMATVWINRTAGWLTAVACVVVRVSADLLEAPEAWASVWLWWNAGASLVVYLAVAWILDTLIRLHRELEQRVRARTAELEIETQRRQQVQRELLELSASERSAMGRELHDQLGQHLVGTAMAAQVLVQRLQNKDEVSAREARKIADLVEQGIAQTRQLARGLMLERVDPDRLQSEVEELCAALRQQFPAVNCSVRTASPARLRDPAAVAQLYRIAQEAMRNACRHSGAKHVHLTLDDLPGKLQLTIEDDGRGLADPEHRTGGIGLQIMQHRAEVLRAHLEITTRPGQGTTVRCEIPAT